MAIHQPEFLAGVIEGFYGPPWTHGERRQLFEQLAGGGLHTYLYAPKDDVKHRAIWREPYTQEEVAGLRALIGAARDRGLRFIYALGPGLDIRYAHEDDLARLRDRFGQLLGLGCEHFALLFDDIPDRMSVADAERFGSFAAAQCQVTNALFRWVRERAPHGRFLFCPTAYCGRMAERQLGGEGYLVTVGRELLPEIDVLWTGPEIVSAEISVAHAQEVRGVLRRRPVIWDNLHANDYDGRRFFCGPYAGRAPELRAEVGGLLANPNNEFPLNQVPLRTLAEFVRCSDQWNPRQAYLAAMEAWLPRFATLRGPVALDDLILLGDCYYLPHDEGPEARSLLTQARELLGGSTPPAAGEVSAFRSRAGRLRDFCGQLAELQDRPLFYALSRRLWELREELDLLLLGVAARVEAGPSMLPLRSDFHLPGTYRGGMVPKLQRLLVQQADGSFVPAERSRPAPTTTEGGVSSSSTA